MCREPPAIHQGFNSGYQAINLALHFGAKRVVLLGFDMGATGDEHWFGKHPTELDSGRDWSRFIQAFESMQPESAGLEVINATRITALRCFPRAPLRTVV